MEGNVINSFIFDMTLIITFTYIKIKIIDAYMEKKSYKAYLVWVYSLLNSMLAVALMMHHITYKGMIFDLRHAPIFISSYLFGYKGGLTVMIAPLFYRLYLGGPNTCDGILIGILLPVAVGILFHTSETSKLRNIINIKRIALVFTLSQVLRILLLLVKTEMTFSSRLYIEANLAVFSYISLICIVMMLNDQIKRLNDQRNLKKSEERYKKLVELLPDPLYVSKGEEIVFVNSAAVKLLGYSDPAQVLYKSLDEVILPHQILYDQVKQQRQILFSRETQLPFTEQTAYLNNGQEIEIEVGSTSFEYRGDYYAITILRDINERKKLQRRKEKLEEEEKLLKNAMEYDALKTEFFANLSHELKTPLNLIYSTVQLMSLKMKNEDKTQVFLEKSLDILKQNCFRMMRLVNNLIDITKIDSGYFELELQEINIVQVVEDIIMSVAHYAESKGMTLLFDTQMEEKYMLIDLNSIERIILNLLSNAIKFTNTGGEILVYVYEHEDNVRISVKDTGVGIPEEKQTQIFERFRQVDKSFARNREGSGIGLSLVKSLVALHGGNITLKSEPGIGTEVIIELPVKKSETENISKANSAQMNMKNNNVEFVNIEFSDIYGFYQYYKRDNDSA